MTPSLLCVSSETQALRPFCEKVFSLEYDQEPDYNELRFLLTKGLLNAGMVPTLEYDWMERVEISTQILS